jgi:hypothetical protein
MKYFILAGLLAGLIAPLSASADVQHPTVHVVNLTDANVHVTVATEKPGTSGSGTSWCELAGAAGRVHTMSYPMSKVTVKIGSKMVCGVGTTIAEIGTTGKASFNGTVTGTHGKYTFTRNP